MNIIITAGGTSEKIDNVRKITNSSSGKLGCVIAETLLNRYDDKIQKIYYICSKKSAKPSNDKIEMIEIENTEELKNAVEELLTNKTIHCFIHSMAVSDYTVDYVTTLEKMAENLQNGKQDALSTLLNYHDDISDTKISSNEKNIVIKLKQTPKIISLIKDISPQTYLVGFKLLDSVSKDHLIEVAKQLKDKNKCNIVVANDLSDIRKGNHKAYILRQDNTYIEANGKDEIAEKLAKEIFYDKKI